MSKARMMLADMIPRLEQFPKYQESPEMFARYVLPKFFGRIPARSAEKNKETGLVGWGGRIRTSKFRFVRDCLRKRDSNSAPKQTPFS
jgi:hypothetical protein